MYGELAGVFVNIHLEIFLLQSVAVHRFGLVAKAGLDVLRNFAHEAHEELLAEEELRALLVLANFSLSVGILGRRHLAKN